MLTKLFFWIGLTIVLITSLSGQFYNTGTESFFTKWNQIKTDSFRIIFPSETTDLALEFANILDKTMKFTAEGHNCFIKRPVNVIIYNKNVLSNGYVVWAPRRMEIISLPPQDMYAQDWLEQLALHEYRHFVQVEALNVGLTKAFSFFTGDIAQGAATAYLPLWFLEGDAIVNETALSSTGRGREASFNQALRALELHKENRFSYDQAILGTYRAYAPDHYKYGYHMVAWANEQYGSEIWSNTLKRVGRFPLIAPFYRALKKQSGLSKVGLYKHTFDSLRVQWNSDISVSDKIMYKSVSTHFESNFVSYKYPYQLNDSVILALRYSIDDINKLVEIYNGDEKVIYTLGSFYGNQIAYSQTKVAWEEIRYHPRWEQISYSVIKIFDLKTKSVEILKKNERHFSPSISKDERKMSVQKIDPTSNSILEIYDISSKKLLKTYQHPDNYQLTSNSWLDSDNIVVVALEPLGKTIYKINTKDDSWTRLFGPTRSNISHINCSDNKVYFTYAYDGKQNIYRLDVSTRLVTRITNSLIGTDYASIDANSKLCFSEYGYEGHKLRILDTDTLKLEDLSEIPAYKFRLAESVSTNAPINMQDTLFDKGNYEVRKYHKTLNSFNIHSWLLPFYFDIDNISDGNISELYSSILPGVNLFSQNHLSTVTSSFGYYYKDGHHYFRPAIYLKSFFPEISWDATIGGPPVVYYQNEIPENLQNYYESNLKVSIPLNFSTSRVGLFIKPYSSLGYSNIYFADTIFYGQDDFETREGDIYYYKGYLKSTNSIYFALQSKMSYKDIYPKWGINFLASNVRYLKNEHRFSDNNLFYSSVYLPGISRHHSIRFTFGVEDGLGERLPLARGYSRGTFNSFLKSQIFSAQYAFPALYPDLSIGPLAYVKRIHINAFYDANRYKTYAINELNRLYYLSDQIQSFGVELGFEMNFLRFFWPVTPILRYSYLPSESEYSFNMFITTNFSLGNRLQERVNAY